MSTQVGWFSKLYTKTTNKHFKRLTKMENETFFFSFLITYTYRFSHLLAKLCREHFKPVLDLPGVFTTGRTTQSFCTGGKYCAVSTTPGSLCGFTVGTEHTLNYSKELHMATGRCGVLTQMDFTDIYGRSPFHFWEAGQNFNLSNACFMWFKWAQRTQAECILYRIWVLDSC